MVAVTRKGPISTTAPLDLATQLQSLSPILHMPVTAKYILTKIVM